MPVCRKGPLFTQANEELSHEAHPQKASHILHIGYRMRLEVTGINAGKLWHWHKNAITFSIYTTSVPMIALLKIN